MVLPNPAKLRTERGVDGTADHSPELPFRVELWDEKRKKVEQVVARAHSAALAEAVFQAACEEYTGRYVTLRRGRKRLAERG
jgi:hypothetical protein